MKIMFGCYVKIYTENFSDEMCDVSIKDEDKIVEFLLQDCGCAFDDNDKLIPGDKNLWYLGTNEKHGFIQVGVKVWKWGWGNSSWDTVHNVILELSKLGMSSENFTKLNNAYMEGMKNFSFMYDIKDYLQRGDHWKHPGNAARKESTDFFNNAKQTLKNDGYKVIS